MKKNKKLDFVKGLYKKEWFILFCFCLILAAIHIFKTVVADDLSFSNVMITNVFDFFNVRYQTWSSRVFIELFLVYLAKHFWLWKIIDICMYLLAYFSFNKILSISKDDYKKKWLIVSLLLLYPFMDMSGAGWAASTMNYFWCFALGLYAFIPVKKILTNDKVKIYEYIISIIVLFYAVNQEQMACLVFGFAIVFMIYYIYKNKKINWYLLWLIIMGLAGVLNALICPGNSVRLAQEIQNCNFNFAEYGLIKKIYIGLLTSFSILIEHCYVIIILLITLILISNKNKKLKLVNVLSIIDLLIVVILYMSRFNLSGIAAIKQIEYLLTSGYFPQYPVTIRNMIFIFAPAIITVLFVYGNITYSLYKVDTKKYLLPIIFMAGVVSRVIIGFTPSIFASSRRGELYMFFLILLIIGYLFKNNEKDVSKKSLLIMMIIFTLYNILSII